MEKLHVQPSELDSLPYYEFEYMTEIYNEIVTERNAEEEKKNSEIEDKYSSKYKPSTQVSKMKMPNFKTPKF